MTQNAPRHLTHEDGGRSASGAVLTVLTVRGGATTRIEGAHSGLGGAAQCLHAGAAVAVAV